MFRTQHNELPSKPKNLKGIDFKESEIVKSTIDELLSVAKDPYASSLALIASAELGDEDRYIIAYNHMLLTLDSLEKIPLDYPAWMNCNAFKAWMWGRILFAVDSMNDVKAITQATHKLSSLLEQKMTNADNHSFFTWARGYLAAVSQKNYEAFSKRILVDTMFLSEKCKNEPENYNALSDALWAWVMNLHASANNNDEQNYAFIKEQMKDLLKLDSVTQVIEKGLLRTSQSNDYPAWALAKIRFAAAMMSDKKLYQDAGKALFLSIGNANQAGVKSEYILSLLDNQLAMLTGRDLQTENDIRLKW